MLRRLLLALATTVTLPLAAARADGPGPAYGPVYKDSERYGAPPPPVPYGAAAPRLGEGRFPGFPPSRFVDGPGYVGSDWGLGRPAYTGLGTRPDWGRSDY